MSLPPDFPSALWQHILTADAGDEDECQLLADQVIEWVDGQHPDVLGEVLDQLRTEMAYGVSLKLLEATWHSESPEGFRAQIAQDWVGTILFGLNDPEGADLVAQHIGVQSDRMSTGFLSDFGDLLMEWGLVDAAFRILEPLLVKTPGDLSVKYNIGTYHKLNGHWAEACQLFEQIAQHQPQVEVLENLFICQIALNEAERAQQTERLIEKVSPQVERYKGQWVQVGLPAKDNMPEELVYGEMVAPHQVRLRGIPERWKEVSYDALVLIDFRPQKVKDMTYFPMLKRLEASQWETTELVVGCANEDVVTDLKNSGFAAREGHHPASVLVTIPPAQKNQFEVWLTTTTFEVERSRKANANAH